MAIEYFDYEPTQAPPWMRGAPDVTKWSQAFGLLRDTIVELYEAAVKVRFVRFAPRDAYDRHGRSRRIERGPGESWVSYKKRLLKPFSLWRWAGTDKGVIDALSFLNLDVQIARNNQVDFDAYTGQTKWWRFWVFIRGHGWAGDRTIDDAPDALIDDDPDRTIDTDAPVSWAQFILRQVRTWKASHTRAAVILYFGDAELIDSRPPRTIDERPDRTIDGTGATPVFWPVR